MITVRKRVIAMLCCITLLVTGLYVAEPAQAQAAESEVSITQAKAVFDLAENARFLNLDISTIADYKSGWPGFITSTNTDFVKEHITFGGGMTYDDFMNGIDRTYVATESIVQFNWKNRTELFQPGWSFTIAQGAPMTYTTNSGATAIAKLDKEYTITFGKGTDTNKNSVEVTSVKKTTFSLAAKNYWGNSSSGSTEFWFDAEDTTVNNFNDKYYKSIVDNQEYEEYVQLGNMNYSELNNDVKLRYVLDGNSRCLQMEDWGTLRNTMKSGDQIIFYKGLPIYYTDTAGTNWRATLDATYVYECRKTNIDGHTQTFNSIKLDDTIGGFGFQSASRSGTWYEEKHDAIVTNFNLQACANDTVKTYTDIMKEKIAEQYIEIAGYTVAQARDLGVEIKYIVDGNSKCLQVRFSGEAKSLPAGTTILLKKGMPIAYGEDADVNKFYTGILDDDYRIVIDETDGSMMRISCHLYGEYNLKEMDLSQRSEGGANNDKYHYWGMPTQDEAFVDVNSRTELRLSKEVMSEYLYLSGHDVTSLYNENDEQAVYLKVYSYLQTIFQGIRFFDKGITYNNGEVMILRKGLPISYTTTDGRTKVITLDKDYGYVYNAETQGFRYDASIEWTEASPEYKLENETVDNLFVNTGDTTGAKRTNLIFTPAENVTLSKVWCNPLEDETIKTYIAFQGSQYTDINAFVENGGDMIFYPNAKAIQIVWGAAWDKIAVGDYFTFKKGMPMPISDTEEMVLNADVSYVVEEKSADKVKLVRYDEVGTWALHTRILGITSKVRETNVQALDVETRQNTIFSDVSGNKYDWLDDDRVKTYVDFAGWSVEKMHEVGVKFAIIKTATDQVFQIQWGGNKDQLPALGEKITFKKGLSFIYTTTENTKKRLTLDRDYVFQVAGSRNWGDNVRTLECANPEDGGTISMTSGQTGYWVGKSNNNCYVYADLNGTIKASENTDPFELDYETLPRYLQVGNVKGDTYLNNGITAKIINEQGTYKINIYWKDDILKVGEKVTLKKDFPILITGTDGITTKYQLDTDYSFTIHDGSADSNNATGLVFTSAKLTTDYQLGDLDGDYLLNANDVELLRKQIVGLLQVENRVSNMDNDYNGNLESTDLVRFKKQLQGKEAEEETYTTIYRNCAGVVTLKKGETLTYEVNKEIGNQNYVRLTFTTTENLTGQFTYSGTKGGKNKTGTEDFYLGFEEIQFEQFLDNYRSNGLNITDKTLQTITLTNVSDRDAQVQLCEVEVADRTVKTDDMLYLKDDSLKIGVDLNMGGTLAYLASLKYMPTEELNSNKEVVIDHTKKATEEVNLINVYDFGRQVQQSYYINVEDPSYKHGKYNDKTWPYNPVQAGDKNHNHSQVIDYRMVNREDCKLIYIKVRAMDWAQNGKTTKSYMESWYQIKENLLYVDNAFVNWEGFQTVTSPHTQELPACYVAQSFDKLVTGNTSYDKQFTTWGNWNDEAENHGPFEADKTPTGSQAPVADWYAWVNDKNTEDKSQDFGVGLYIPNTTGCVAGRVFRSRGKDVTEKINSSWKDTYANRGAADAPILSKGLSYLNAMQKTEYQNAFVYNTSYTAPMVNAILKDYTSYEYTYVLTADTLDQMETNFNGLKDTVTNEVLLNWNH